MRSALISLVLGCCAITSAMADDRLEPCSNPLQEYERQLETLIQGAMPGAADFWVVVIPSFTPEWSVGVSIDNGRYLLTHVVLDRQLWQSGWVKEGDSGRNDAAKRYAQAASRTTNISAELYSALRSEWERSIKGARPAESETIVVDGVMYTFRLPGQCASISSPASATRDGKLVDLVFELARLADHRRHSVNARSEGHVLKQLGELGPLID